MHGPLQCTNHFIPCYSGSSFCVIGPTECINSGHYNFERRAIVYEIEIGLELAVSVTIAIPTSFFFYSLARYHLDTNIRP